MTPNHWYQPAQQLWQQQQKRQAIELLLAEIKKTPLGYYFSQATVYLYMYGHYMGASQMAEKAVALLPSHLEAKQNLVVALNKAERYQECLEHAEQLLQIQPDNYMVYDVLAVVYAKLKQYEKAQQAGTRALTIKHQMVGDVTQLQKQSQNQLQKNSKQTLWQLPTIDKEKIYAKKKVVAFSLFGEQARYIQGAIRNLSLMADIYPNWQAWIYLDDSVPKEYQTLFTHMGAIIKKQPNQMTLRQKLCWRFQVANDAEVGYFIVRDIDSVINVREKMAVDKWLAGHQYFHVMRDWWSHTDLILAGMWGGVANTLPNINAMLTAYQTNKLDTPNIDQQFLRDKLWCYIKHSVCIHDRFFHLNDASQNIVTTNPWHQDSPTLSDASMPQKIKHAKDHIGSCEWSTKKDFQKKMVAPWLAFCKTIAMEAQTQEKQSSKNKVKPTKFITVQVTHMDDDINQLLAEIMAL